MPPAVPTGFKTEFPLLHDITSKYGVAGQRRAALTRARIAPCTLGFLQPCILKRLCLHDVIWPCCLIRTPGDERAEVGEVRVRA